MKLEDARKNYYDLSGLASSGARQLAFAGIAVVWIMAAQDGADEQSFRAPLLAFVLALAADLLQYYLGALAWGMFAWLKERANETEFSGAPDWINWPAIGGFWGKGLLVAVGYAFLIELLWPLMFMG